MNPSPVDEIRVCSRCRHRPKTCRCGEEILGRKGGALQSVAVRDIRAREIVSENVLTRPGTEKLVEILLDAAEAQGAANVRFKLSTTDALDEAIDEGNLTLLRRSLFGEQRSCRHAHREHRGPVRGVLAGA